VDETASWKICNHMAGGRVNWENHMAGQQRFKMLSAVSEKQDYGLWTC